MPQSDKLQLVVSSNDGPRNKTGDKLKLIGQERQVLSESTEARDRGVRFHRYQTWSPTLTDYVLVSQEAPLIEHFERQADGSWTLRIYRTRSP